MDICKTKHIKIFPRKHAATYSQSWDGKEAFAANRNASKTGSFIKTSPHRRVPQPPRSSGLDPTAPHLKYGLFPKKIYISPSISRGQSRDITTTPTVGKPSQMTDQSDRNYRINSQLNLHNSNQVKQTRSKVERQVIVKTPTVQTFIQNKSSKAHGEVTDSPTFVFRPLEHRNLQSLTVSKSTHLDIKPKPTRASTFSPPLYKKYRQNL